MKNFSSGIMVTSALPEFITDLSHAGIDVVTDFLRTFTGKDAQITAAYAHVRADAADRDADKNSLGGLRLTLEDIAQFFLDEPCNFILAGCFHIIVQK